MIIAINGKIKGGKDEFCKRMQYNIYLKIIEKNKCKFTPINWEKWCELPLHERNFLSKSYRKSFADKLKLCASSIIGIDLKKYDDRDLKENHYVNLHNFNLLHISNIPKDANIISSPEEIVNIFENKILEKNMWATFRTFMLQYYGTNVCRKHMPHIWCNSIFSDYETKTNIIITDLRFPNEADFCRDFKDSVLIKIIRAETDIMAGIVESETALDNYRDFDFVVNNNGTLDEFHKKIDDIFFLLHEKYELIPEI